MKDIIVTVYSCQGLVLIDYDLGIEDHQSPVEVGNCADEILAHVSDHSNWPDPILPPG